MADVFKGIITADGKKRQLPYGAVLKTPISDETLSIQGGFADAKVVGDKFKEAKAETDSLKEDLGDFIYSRMQYVDSATSLVDTLWRDMPTGLVRATGFNGFTTFSPFSVPKGTYYISKKNLASIFMGSKGKWQFYIVI